MDYFKKKSKLVFPHNITKTEFIVILGAGSPTVWNFMGFYDILDSLNEFKIYSLSEILYPFDFTWSAKVDLN